MLCRVSPRVQQPNILSRFSKQHPKEAAHSTSAHDGDFQDEITLKKIHRTHF